MTLHLNLISEEEWKQSRNTPHAERITKLEKERSKGRHKIFCKIANPRLKSEAVAGLAKSMVLPKTQMSESAN
jgi:hypothetical protein